MVAQPGLVDGVCNKSTKDQGHSRGSTATKHVLKLCVGLPMLVIYMVRFSHGGTYGLQQVLPIEQEI